ncbi:MAG: GNAT family N-acetyltransferase [Alphaproteobacteria bacterium]|nr:GNAT family N-acetyltransferase [Alphaproteobacteria bacterium]
MAADIVIRAARRRDAAAIWRLLRAMARYERLEAHFRTTPAAIARDLTGRRRRAECALAWRNRRAVGVIIWYATYSTFHPRAGVFVEDVFVSARLRHGGVGRALLAHVARRALAAGGSYLSLEVLNWNPAMGFYRRLGFAAKTGWRSLGLAEAALQDLARSA